MIGINKSSTQKFNENAHFCKPAKSSLAVSGCWDLFSTILINRFFKSLFSWNQLNPNIRARSSSEFFRNWVMLLTFTIDSSVEIQNPYFHESFQLRSELRSIRASTLALVFDEHFGLRFDFGGNFGLEASKFSTASVFAFGLWRVLRARTLRRCQWIMLYLCIYTVATVILNFVGDVRCSRASD